MTRPIRAVWYPAPVWREVRRRTGDAGLVFDRLARDLPLAQGWPTLAHSLLRFGAATGDKKANPPKLWSPIELVPDDQWCKADNVAWVHLLVMDYDDGTTIEDASARWEPWEHVLHTSWSHSKDAHKLRVVLPLIDPMPGAEWRDIYTEVLTWDAERSGLTESDAADAGLRADRACKDPSRMFYVPALGAHGADAGHVSRWHGAQDGEDARPWLCLHDMRQRASQRRTKAAAERIARRDAAQARARSVVDSSAGAEREVKRRLMEDHRAREALASALGASIVGDGADTLARRVVCPACQRKAVWWVIDPTAMRRAKCNHAESCGWSGHLWELAVAHGVAL